MYPGRVVPLEIFVARKFGIGFLGGYILVQGIFFFFLGGGGGGGCLKPLGFFWILIIAPIRSSRSLAIWSTPASGPEGVHLRDKSFHCKFTRVCMENH